jgi:hypothetical protein
MSWSDAGDIATCVQAALLIVAAYFAVSQVREASRARKLAVLMPLRYEIDSLDARRNRHALFNDLPDDLTSLAPEEDEIVDRVVVEYDNLGMLIRVGLIDVDLLAQLYSPSTERCWRRVESWVGKERARRGHGLYANGFEMFAKHCIAYNARLVSGGLTPFRRESANRAPGTNQAGARRKGHRRAQTDPLPPRRPR